ncbi:endonuclease/exonuclease/phosphatase family protein [Actinoallomurus sp. NBC_01490]|uniref:endonuclease/exonuclease/phosphatase family protein n=1 Tax=Actinoallomurus sp. NBC_01490 TaxID=2903557 RepID=UPI002E2EF483|nr:endonuclease/exonuclease/phosphatase family protein [Actinoallomurus sp. NBC_01490]
MADSVKSEPTSPSDRTDTVDPHPTDAPVDAGTADTAGPPQFRYPRIVLAMSVLWTAFALFQTALSGHWWLMLAPDLIPPLAFALIPLLLAAAVPTGRMMRRSFTRWQAVGVLGVCAASLTLGLPWSGVNFYALDDHPAVPASALRIMSWNTESWGKDTTPNRFYSYLRAQDADVYLLQEVIRSDADDANPRAVPDADITRIYREFRGWNIVVRGELVTISRFPIVSRPAVGPDRALSNQPNADWRTVFLACKALRTDLLVGRSVLSVYNVHIPVQVDMRRSPFTPGFYRTLRDRNPARQEQYHGLLADLTANRNPALIAGDFNTSPAMGDIEPLRERLNDASRVSDSFYPISWNQLGSLRLWRLDWAFTTQGLKVDRYALKPAPHGYSDHRAQFIRASLGS